jgi:DNA-binding NtrC family response regulator
VARILRDRQSAPAAGEARRQTAMAPQIVVDNSNGEIGIIGSCPPMQDLYSKIRKVAPTDSNVLIQGESGTGKELVARALHNLSKRAKAPMISVNCAAIPESLIESELFGHEKARSPAPAPGAPAWWKRRTAARCSSTKSANCRWKPRPAAARAAGRRDSPGGFGAVAKVDVRLIAATHRDLKSLAKIGQFREDLYYRLHVIALKLPALRERGADVNEIANAFLARQSARINRTDLKFAADAEQAIRHYSWPGNVRELENAVERAVILSESPEISADLLGIDIELSDLEDDEFIGLPRNRAAPATAAMSRPKTCRWKTTSSTSSLSIRTT